MMLVRTVQFSSMQKITSKVTQNGVGCLNRSTAYCNGSCGESLVHLEKDISVHGLHRSLSLT